ncbi:NAD(P)/FAD-dependent oxidoreductase [Flavobacterium oreochromis]|uniref:NAD(P)/FAD-dependent oxidoreductase n=1 Tax=Flavobacterium oreochromis TaxID=2906078 RepID=UPI002164CC30|nr:FAD-dependent oxidoreductase [Flavobacterium oreochromis]
MKKVSQLVTSKGNFDVEEVVLATGAWSPNLAKKIGTDISLLPGKGYSFTLFEKNHKPSIPSILCEGKVAVTPMNNDIRFGGTMEITHTGDTKINKNRLQGILNTVNTFYPEMKVSMPNNRDVWYGFRPCTPSGMPIITRDKKIKNVILATGHAMMGLSLAPATGKLISEMIANKPLSVSIHQFQLS